MVGFNTNGHILADTRNVLACMKCRSLMEAPGEATRLRLSTKGVKKVGKKRSAGSGGVVRR